MRGEPFTRDWELLVRSDLAPHLVPPGQLRGAQRPGAVSMVPGGALEALRSCVGRCGLEDLLLVPASACPAGPWWRRRCRYAPLCVLGIGERGLGLWVQALPTPDVRLVLPFSEIGAAGHSARGPWRELTVTGRNGKLSVRYGAGGDDAVGLWLRRLRTRCAGRPQPLPAPSAGKRPHLPGPRPHLPGDAVTEGRRLPWHGPCLLAVTSQELIVSQSRREWPRPWRTGVTTVYMSRCGVTEAAVGGRSLLLCSAGAAIRLSSRAVAAAASRWLKDEHGKDPAGSRPGQRDRHKPGTRAGGYLS